MNPRILASVAWLCICLSLGVWWTIMGLRHAQDIANLEKNFSPPEEVISRLERKSTMIKYEGITFLILIALGGFTLIAMSFRDERRNRMIKNFFATVSHEMKTPLASLRLQAESLSEIVKNKTHKKLLKRLISDTQRLELQMEKAIYLASLTRAESLYVSTYTIQEILSGILGYYENVKFVGDPHIKIKCDKKAMESILKNLVENAFYHGEATLVVINTLSEKEKVCLQVSDNGKGFQGNPRDIGKLFLKHTPHSGTGVGLYLVKTLVKKMNGKVSFEFPSHGFIVKICLPVEIMV